MQEGPGTHYQGSKVIMSLSQQWILQATVTIDLKIPYVAVTQMAWKQAIASWIILKIVPKDAYTWHG